MLMRNRLPAFSYYEANSVDEALGMLHEGGEGARILAGGTDLIVAMRMKGTKPSVLVNIKTIPSLAEITEQGGELHVGPLLTMEQVERYFCAVRGCACLSHAARVVGSWQVRCRATIGGNICNGAPSAETAPALLALGAEAVIASYGGVSEVVDLENFFVGPGSTICGHDRLLVRLVIPRSTGETRTMYIKHSPRRAMDIAVVGVATSVTMDKNQRVADARIALGAVAPVPIRVHEAEESLVGAVLDQCSIRTAAKIAASAAKPVSDVRASAEYRREMVEVLVVKALGDLADQGGRARK